MLIEIWSDVMCPFCYLGKRRFERALTDFDGRDDVQVVWKSFQLNPSIPRDAVMSSQDYLSREKGINRTTAQQMNARVAEAGRLEGITYKFDDVRVVNTFDAHRALHFARAHDKQTEMEERLFAAHFTEGRNVADRETLVGLGRDIGLDEKALTAALNGGDFADDVHQDIDEARQLGINAVPFFVLDRKYAVSGAQDPSTFLGAMRRLAQEEQAGTAG